MGYIFGGGRLMYMQRKFREQRKGIMRGQVSTFNQDLKDFIMFLFDT